VIMSHRIIVQDFLQNIADVIEQNRGLFQGEVEAFLLGEGTLPRQFLRYVEADPVVYTFVGYTLFGLSGYALGKLLVRLMRELKLRLPDLVQTVLVDDWERIQQLDIVANYANLPTPLDDANFDQHPYTFAFVENVESFSESLKHYSWAGNYLILSFVISAFVFGQYGVMFGLLLLMVVAGFVYTKHIQGIVSVSHYSDLVSWAYGRERNASLFHAMRARLYRKFWSQYQFDDIGLAVFTATLDAAYVSQRDKEI